MSYISLLMTGFSAHNCKMRIVLCTDLPDQFLSAIVVQMHGLSVRLASWVEVLHVHDSSKIGVQKQN